MLDCRRNSKILKICLINGFSVWLRDINRHSGASVHGHILRNGREQFKAVMVIQSGGNQLLKDAQKCWELVGRDNLLCSTSQVRLKQSHQRRNISCTISIVYTSFSVTAVFPKDRLKQRRQKRLIQCRNFILVVLEKLGNDLKHVGREFRNVELQDGLHGRKEQSLKFSNQRGIRAAQEPAVIAINQLQRTGPTCRSTQRRSD